MVNAACLLAFAALCAQVCAEASIIFPLLVAQTFARDGPRQPIA